MPRLTGRERLIAKAMLPPPRPSYLALELEVRSLRQDNEILLRELERTRQAAGLPEVSYLSHPA